MERVRRFGRNAGLWGGVWVGLVILLLLVLVVQEAQERSWAYVPLFGVAFTLSYLLRNQLVQNHRVVHTVMNRLALAVWLVALFLRQSDFSGPPWVGGMVAAFVGAYVGCYFWLLSDPRIVIRR